MLDDLCLISDERVVYSGARDEALVHFESLGYHLPEGFSPSDFILDLISVDGSSPENEARSRERLDLLINAWEGKRVSQGLTPIKESLMKDNQAVPVGLGNKDGDRDRDGVAGDGGKTGGKTREPPLREKIKDALTLTGSTFQFLLVRSWRQVSRDKATNIARIMANVSSADLWLSLPSPRQELDLCDSRSTGAAPGRCHQCCYEQPSEDSPSLHQGAYHHTEGEAGMQQGQQVLDCVISLCKAPSRATNIGSLPSALWLYRLSALWPLLSPQDEASQVPRHPDVRVLHFLSLGDGSWCCSPHL